jgi:hypothetical protein
MRAVNLIPADLQRGAGGAAGRSSGGAYIVLGALAVLVVMVASLVLAGNSVSDKKAELATLSQQADAAEARAHSLASYTKFSAIRTKRVQTVQQIAASRFDWSHALHEVARVLPRNAWLTTLTGTTTPSVTIGGSGGGSLRGALPVPAIEIVGCTTRHHQPGLGGQDDGAHAPDRRRPARQPGERVQERRRGRWRRR